MKRPWERARDLDRGEEEFRDTRLIVVACDDTYAPKQYFDFSLWTVMRKQSMRGWTRF